MAAIGNIRRDSEPQTISVEDLAALRDPVIIDVRSESEYAEGHIDGAVLIPLGDLERRRDEVPDADTVYVVCQSGKRSAEGAAILRRHGRSARSLEGGMSAWEAADRPVVG